MPLLAEDLSLARRGDDTGHDVPGQHGRCDEQQQSGEDREALRDRRVGWCLRARGLTADRRVAAQSRIRADIRDAVRRSEEHTSELQSLMRISYAGLCLKIKIQSRKTA